MAGDPTAFPEQLAPARALHGVGNLTEGLHPWQGKKLYYFTDAFDGISQYWNDPRDVSPFRPNFLVGAGPEYSNAEISRVKGISFGHLGAIEASFYQSQGGVGDLAKKAIDQNDLRGFEEHPIRLIFGKSVQPNASYRRRLREPARESNCICSSNRISPQPRESSRLAIRGCS